MGAGPTPTDALRSLRAAVAANRIMLIGPGDLAEEVRQGLDALDADVVRLLEPTDREVQRAIDGGVDRVAIIGGDDAFVVRMTLMVRSADQDIPMLATAFDRTTAAQLRELGDTEVTSLADIVAPSLAGPCLGEDLEAIRVTDDGPVGLKATGDGVEEVEVEVPPRRRLRGSIRALVQPHDKSAALLLAGAVGLIAVLLVETISAAIVLEQNIVDAFYGASKTLVTVDPNDKVQDGPKAFKVFISLMMLLALLFEALFTAGIVNRLIDRRLTGLVGKNAVPRRDHVVVIGLGQVGMRLCLLLRRCGIGIVAVDNQEDGENVGVAKELGLPVVIGRGADPSMLRRLSLDRAVALAAVTQDDLENISIAMAARSINPDLRVVLRAGDGELANETRSLFQLGIVRDVHRIAAALIAARLMGSDAEHVICHDDEAHLLHDDGSIEPASITAAA